MPLLKDIWRVGIVKCPLAVILARQSLEGLPVVWTPKMRPLCFRADPFGFWHNGNLHIFVEDYDYRVRIGSIDVLIYSSDLQLIERKKVLQTPWHLSYPYVFEADGAIWMLPEAHRSGKLTLYRSVQFPYEWEPVTVIELGGDVAVDATPYFQNGMWWLFYTPARPEISSGNSLCVAYAKTLLGPWTRYNKNPITSDISNARPGGTPFVLNENLILPVQDCTKTYGSGIKILTFTCLTPDLITIDVGKNISIPQNYAPFNKGFHTLSAAGDITLIDAKYIDCSLRNLALQSMHALKKLTSKKKL